MRGRLTAQTAAPQVKVRQKRAGEVSCRLNLAVGRFGRKVTSVPPLT